MPCMKLKIKYVMNHASLPLLLLQALLIDPVVAADGHTYERQALQAWLQHHSISPITGEHLTHRHLVDNAVIKSLLQQQMLQGR